MRKPRPTPIDCDAALDALQRELDGDGPAFAPGLSEHLKQCVDCRERFAAARALLAAYPPAASADLTDRISVAVQSDLRARRWRASFITAVAIAACLVVALSLSLPTPIAREQPPVAEAPKSIESRLADARTALRQQAGELAQALPRPDDFALVRPDDLGAAIEPTTSSLAETTRGIADGFQPVTGSAKRALALFRRELPGVE